MLKNYFKIAWRNISRSKGYAAINIGGLGIGMAASILILIWVQFELSVDRFYEDSDRIYAVWRNDNNQGEIFSWDYTPAPYAPTMREQFPEVEQVSRITEWDPQLLSVGENSFYENTSFVDPDFFRIFPFEVLAGNPVQALDQPNTIILTQSTAQKLFGEEDAMGKTVSLAKQLDLEVRAIIQDLPENTDFKFKAFFSFSKLEQMGWVDDFWGNNSYRTFVKLHEGTDIRLFNEKFASFTSKNSDAESITDFLFPMEDLHLKSKFENGVSAGGRIDLIRMFGIVAVIILLIACINFINLSTAQSENRAKEVGVRKISGAGRGMLISQFLVESVLIAFFSFMLALLIVSLVFPWFRDLMGKDFTNPLVQPYFWMISGAYILLTGILAGSYPAFLLSSFRPAIVFKSKIQARRYWVHPREVLVVFQFAIVAILISSAWIIRDQMNFVQERDLGLDKENLIFHPVTEAMRKNKQALRNELLQLPEVKSVTYTFSPLTEIYSNTNAMNWQGKAEDYRPEMSRMGSDAGLLETAGMELIAGRDIDVYQYPSDSMAAVLNESAVEKMGFSDPIGQVIEDDDLKFTVVGVVKDFIMESPFDEIKPIVVMGPKRNLNFIHLRVHEGVDYQSTMAGLSAVFSKFNPGAPFEYEFVDQAHAKKFVSQQRTANLTEIFSALAILISCMGLFGLATFIAQQRSKEISVRKVLGASVLGLVRMISADFAKLVLLAVILGIPLTWYIMDAWLDSFSYRVTIDWTVFLFTGLVALLIALLTVSSQAIKAALVNPAKTLKSE
ncbi:ABC transporter permease [Algoriphagus halophytocola]|uniref:ABC transporter permease n=1 Tax=Algoriphagus halophytocola TaxID=2991499 RepID=A0ABY6MJJ5_9BACT|nr:MULTISPECIES: ABC transporter permease [unclassified Algoriphagus]UZD23960.1 ABC transporter permease [Algoriphagus sp. TR-M5]WBL41332.1 ABC transporter permease [Algoriphagus sp. TR-M9]